MRAHRTLSFPIDWAEPRLDWLTKEFRLIVNKSIRVALQGDLRSRARLTRAAYANLSREHAVHKQYVVIPLYDLLALPASAREEPSGVEPGASKIT